MLNKTVNFEDTITFTRNSTASYRDKDGVLQTAAIDEPRLDHDPVTGEPLGLMVEEQRTNLIEESQQWNTFTASDGTSMVSEETTDLAPIESLTNVARVEKNNTGAWFVYISQGGLVNGNVYTFSFFIKPLENVASFGSETSASGRFRFRYDIATGVISVGVNAINASVTALKNGWYRCATTASVTSTSDILSIIVTPNDTGLSGSFLLIGYQLEAGAFPTSYIPTSGSSATRAADVVDVGYSTWHETSGTYLVEFQSYSPDTVLTDGDLDVDAAATTIKKIAVSFDGYSSLKSIDGATAVAGPGVTTGSELELMPAASGHIRSVSFYPEILDASDLEALTA